MPTYSARCLKCDNEKDYIAKIVDMNNTPLCCKKPMERFITSTMICQIGISDHFSIKSPVDGKTIYGRSEYLKLIKENKICPSSDMVGEAEHRMKAINAETKANGKNLIDEAITNTLRGK